MHAQSYSNTPGFWFIGIGLFLSLISALVPHFDAGYRLALSVFSAGVLPYLVYSAAAALQRSTLITVIGFIVVAIHTWLVISERIIGQAEYSSGMIINVPLVMALAMLPLALSAIMKASKY